MGEDKMMMPFYNLTADIDSQLLKTPDRLEQSKTIPNRI
jgi:hypothetical protein